MAFSSIERPNSRRNVFSSAIEGLVAPIKVLYWAMASGASSTCTTTGPELIYWQRSSKKARSLCSW